MKNNISIDLEDNEEMQDLFSDKAAGDTCTLVVDVEIAEKTDSAVTGVIEAVDDGERYADDYEERPVKKRKGKKSSKVPVISIGVGEAEVDESERVT